MAPYLDMAAHLHFDIGLLSGEIYNKRGRRRLKCLNTTVQVGSRWRESVTTTPRLLDRRLTVPPLLVPSNPRTGGKAGTRPNHGRRDVDFPCTCQAILGNGHPR